MQPNFTRTQVRALAIQKTAMALSDTWLKEFEEASKLSEDINGRLREREIIVSLGGDPSHLIATTRRKITILGTCSDRLESLLQNPPEKPRLTDEEVYRRQDMLLGLRFKTKQMASSFSTSPSNRYMPNLGETTTKDTVDSAKAAETESNVMLLPPNHAKPTQQHSVGVVEEPSLHTRLLMNEREEPNPQTKGTEDAQSKKGCNVQLTCLVILGILVLLLLVWTIIRIW